MPGNFKTNPQPFSNFQKLCTTKNFCFCAAMPKATPSMAELPKVPRCLRRRGRRKTRRSTRSARRPTTRRTRSTRRRWRRTTPGRRSENSRRGRSAQQQAARWRQRAAATQRKSSTAAVPFVSSARVAADGPPPERLRSHAPTPHRRLRGSEGEGDDGSKPDAEDRELLADQQALERTKPISRKREAAAPARQHASSQVSCNRARNFVQLARRSGRIHVIRRRTRRGNGSSWRGAKRWRATQVTRIALLIALSTSIPHLF